MNPADGAKLVAVVTGAARGIGRATAEDLKSRGYAVVEIDREPVSVTGVDADSMSLAVDVTDSASVEISFARIAERYGRIDVLVNNVGLPARHVTATITDDEWSAMMRVNIDSALYCSRAAYPMLSRRGGAIVNVSSIGGVKGMDARAAYSTSKSAILGLTRALATEWGRDGIRVNAVAPGYVRTEGFEERMTTARGSEIIAWLEEEVPLGRLCLPHEIATAVCFLAGPDASYITGHTLIVDGGVTTRVRG